MQRPTPDGEALAGLQRSERQNDNEAGHAPSLDGAGLPDLPCRTAEIFVRIDLTALGTETNILRSRAGPHV
ncbi:hypothetical protein CLE01_05150 [Cryobacterium levicorallinum]|nr:hypothetical protein CLE01_05150 [Cryobacterium levicorallinum]